MTKLVFSNIFRFLALIVVQILFLNYVNFGGYMIPFIYILAVLMLPTRMGRIPMLLVAFGAGLIVDLFCNIPGFHTFSCTMMAFFRIILGNRMLTRDAQSYMAYLIVMAVVYSLTYSLLEAFSFGNFGITMLSALLDAAVTWVLMMLFQLFLTKKISTV